jgi:hypothetical protein
MTPCERSLNSEISTNITDTIVSFTIALIVYSRLASKRYFLTLEIQSISFGILDELSSRLFLSKN